MNDDDSKRKKIYCGNCGKYGHLYKKCSEPITSVGIINIKIDGYNIIDKIDRSNININKYNNMNSLLHFHEYADKIKFLMIQRKNTVEYIEFIRGKYELNDYEYIIFLFQHMMYNEIELIKNNDFDYLWKDLWKYSASNKNYEYEYNQSLNKFNLLKNDKKFNINFLVNNIEPLYKHPEWGFPKGRRNLHEKNIDCAKREFIEETGLNNDDYNLIDNIIPINEVFNGTNGILYKHIYYIGFNNNMNNPIIDPLNELQNEEIGDIGWFNYYDIIKMLRPYHKERIKIIIDIILFLINILRK